ncbi:MAG TPA: DUF4350 domain-containing protein [Blastocatellia bacterium]|nr:DUF4350 domain-containing protein [Blastocatellia bacterium]
MRTTTKLFLVFCLCLAITALGAAEIKAQQVPDPDFKPPIEKPAYAEGKGPVVLIDEAHFNFHTASGRYQSFADLVRRDGYVAQASKEKFSKESLKAGKILVIANALSQRNASDWNPPFDPSFTDEEIGAVREWVNQGGSLMMMVDHFPMPATAGKLAEAFGVRIHNGYAVDLQASQGRLLFTRADKSLADHPITRGRSEKEKIDSVATFTGSAFQIDRGDPILTFLGAEAISYTPKAFGQRLDKDTPRVPIKGWHQGVVIRVGKGRVAIFGEAAMFSAQLAGPQKATMGMNDPIAKQNPQFLLNVMHWLSGLLQE